MDASLISHVQEPTPHSLGSQIFHANFQIPFYVKNFSSMPQSLLIRWHLERIGFEFDSNPRSLSIRERGGVRVCGAMKTQCENPFSCEGMKVLGLLRVRVSYGVLRRESQSIGTPLGAWFKPKFNSHLIKV